MAPIPDDGQLVPATPDAGGGPIRRRTGALINAIRNAAKPVPLERPQVNTQLAHLAVLERSAEVLRYSALRLEYWLCPGGQLRAWFKLNMLLSSLLAIPVVLVMPVITLFLSTLATWSQYVLVAAVNVLLALLAAAAIAAVASAGLVFLRFLWRR